MLSALLAHAGQPPAPHDLWAAWNLDPVLVAGFGATAWAYRRGAAGRWRDVDRPRAWCFAAALVALGVALVSPLDALSGALASAHMVQHVLLVLVAAPLLALSAPSADLLRGSPSALRGAAFRWRRRLRLTSARLRPLRHPVTVWLLHVGALWFWHAAGPYDAALASEPIHILEHASFLLTGLLFWRVVVSTRGAVRVPHGFAILLVFTMALQSTFLAMLLTFANSPWYSGYATTTRLWRLHPLADQQLAGVIMWIPAGIIYVGAAIGLTVVWLRAIEADEDNSGPRPGVVAAQPFRR